MEVISQFSYIYSNLSLYQFQANWIFWGFILILGMVLMAFTYYASRLLSLYAIIYHSERALARKKKTLWDLILMKDIQTELEKEIEQAILKAAFHS